jgi:Flp pilus assembly protein TadD
VDSRPAPPRPGSFRPWTTRQYALTQPRSAAAYLGLFLLPRGQTLDRDVIPSRSPFEPAVLGSLAILGALAVIGALAARSHAVTALGVFVFFLALLPTTSVVKSPDLFFEHRAYLPMAGLCLALGPLVGTAHRRRAGLTWLGLGVLVATLSVATTRRNSVWDTELSLWTDTVAKAPAKARPRVNLGLALRNAGRFDEAEQQYRRALELEPHYPFALNNLGTILRLQGRPDEAAPLFHAAITARPRYADPRINLGNLAMDRGDLVGAETWYREALELREHSVPARYNLARSLERQGRPAEAVAEYARVVAERPEQASFHNDLGCARLAAGDPAGAESDLRRAIALDAESATAWYNLALALQARGRTAEAHRAHARALEIDPGLVPPP